MPRTRSEQEFVPATERINPEPILDTNLPRSTPAAKRSDLLPGFPETSSFLARDPAKTTVIFRRFDKLAVRNLLYLEARLTALEKLQIENDRKDAQINFTNEPIVLAAKSWEDFAVFGTLKENGQHTSNTLPTRALTEWAIKRKGKAAINFHKAYGKVETDNETKPLNIRYKKLSSLELEKGALGEAPVVFDNSLGCGPYSLALIQERWELAMAIETTLREYRTCFRVNALSQC